MTTLASKNAHMLMLTLVCLILFFIDVSASIARTLITSLDVSGSTLLVDDQRFADRVAAYVAAEVKELAIGDTVQVHLVGSYIGYENLQRFNVKISRQNRPEQVAARVATIISSMPTWIQTKKVNVAQETSLTGYFLGEAPALDCQSTETHLLVVTDGVESVSVDARALLAGKAPLPRPRKDILKNCQLTLLGIGVFKGGKEAYTAVLSDAWRNWATEAGIVKYRALPRF